MVSRARTGAILLALPLTAFILVTFVAPLGSMFLRSLYDPLVAGIMPETIAGLGEWDGTGLPAEQVYALAARELALAREGKTIGKLATRLNRDTSGMRSVIMRTGRGLKRADAPPWSEALPELHPAWGEPEIWQTLVRTGARVTPIYYLNAVDLTFDNEGGIIQQPEDRRIYTTLFIKTIRVSLTITLLCLVIGYPVAYLIAHSPPRRSRMLLVLVLVPFWTSLLVRTTSWIVLLQQQGVVNDLLVWFGLVADEQRLTMIHNMTGTLVAMTHVLLPFMILPLYSVMRGIPRGADAGRHVAGGLLAQGLLPGLPAAVPAGRGRRLPAGIHPGHRLLHHPGAGGRAERAVDFQLHCLPYTDLPELGPGRSPGLCIVCRGTAVVPGLRPRTGSGSNAAGGMTAHGGSDGDNAD